MSEVIICEGLRVGGHDFAAFTVAKDGSTVRDIRSIDIFPESEASAGKRTPDSVANILAGGDVRAAGARAPAKGLWLERVDYD